MTGYVFSNSKHDFLESLFPAFHQTALKFVFVCALYLIFKFDYMCISVQVCTCLISGSCSKLQSNKIHTGLFFVTHNIEGNGILG